MTTGVAISVLAAAGGGGGSQNFLIPNATIFAELVIFLIVFGLLWRYVLPPVRRSMDGRQEMVRRQVEESQQAAERLAAADARYREALAEARAEAAQIRDEARAEAQRTRDELRSQAEQEVAEIRRRGEEQLAGQRERAVGDLRPQIGELAVTLAQRVAGDSLEDEGRRRETVDRFVDELDSAPARESA